MSDEKKEEKKIILDEDWKKQAQAEKERLAAEAAGEKAGKEEAPTDIREITDKEKPKDSQETHETKGGERGPLPPGDFSSLISMLATQAYMALGAIRPPEEKEFEPDFEFARYLIDILGALEEKTTGNLSEDETEMLRQALHSLRMLYVKLSK